MIGCHGNCCTAVTCHVGTAEHSVEASAVGLIGQVALHACRGIKWHTFKIV